MGHVLIPPSQCPPVDRGEELVSHPVLFSGTSSAKPLLISMKQVSSPGSRVIVNSVSCTIHHRGIPDLPLASLVTDISVSNSFFRQVSRQDESAHVIGGSPYQSISMFLAPRLAQELPLCNILGQQLFEEYYIFEGALYLSAGQGDGVSSRWQWASGSLPLSNALMSDESDEPGETQHDLPLGF